MNQLRSAAPLRLPAATLASRLQRWARRAVPALGDFCLVYVVAGEGIVARAGTHVNSHGRRLVRTLMRVYRVKRSDRASAVAHVIRTSKPLLRTTIRPESEPPLASSAAATVAQLHELLAPRSALVVPIVLRNQVLGAFSLCYSQSGRAYSMRDIATASRIALHIAHLLAATRAHGSLGLHAAARHAGQGTTFRRRVASRN
jgi:GAF domain-containing protein